MRVLLTTDTIGGVWTFTRELAGGLLAQGHAVALVSLGRLPPVSQQSWAEMTTLVYQDQFCYISSSAPLEWMQENATAYTAGEATLLRMAADFAPDLLHTNQFCFGCLPLAIPRVVGGHSDVVSWAEACRPRGLEPSPWLVRYRGLVERGLASASAVAVPTCWMGAALTRNFPVQAPVHVVLNGRTLPARSDLAYELQAVSAGRLWDEAKHLALLTRVRSPMPILVAGETEPARSASASGAVELLGALAEEDLLAVFRRSAIYIVSSIYEPFGLAPLEAALCGCAVVANDLPSLREVWGEAALYFSGASALEQILRTLSAAPTALAEARARSYRHALTLNARRMTDSYIALYKDLCGSAVSSEREAVYV